MRGHSCGDFSLWSLWLLTYGDAPTPPWREGNTQRRPEPLTPKLESETKDKDRVYAVPIESMASHQELNSKTLPHASNRAFVPLGKISQI